MSQENIPAEESSVRATGRRLVRVFGPEARIAVAFFCCAFVMGVVYVSTWGGKAEFWQQVFAPAVMMACGHGFTNPHMDEVPELEEFLYLRAARFDCGSIPEDITVLPTDTSGMTYAEIQAFHPLDQFPGWTQWQQFHRYLLLSVALMFSLFGVAWASLTPLYGFLYGATTALGYGIFRLGMGRWMAVIGGALLMTSPVHLQQLPQLRDYSKAPFFFLLILIMVWLLKRPRPLKQAVPLAAVAGLFGGIGLGFRQDVSIAAAVFCVLLVVFWPGTLKQTWWKRLAVVTSFAAAFAILGTPIVQVLLRVNNSPHDTLIGFMRYCDQRLGVEASLYDFGDPFKDEYVRAILMGYAHRTEGRTAVFRHYSPAYDAAGKAYFREMASTFPADLILRGYASVLRIVDELQISSANNAPRGITNQFVARLYQWRQLALDHLPGGGRYHVAAMLLVLSAVNLRLGFATFLGSLVLGGYPALRFSVRHAFHMEILSLFATAFLIYWGLWGLRVLWQRGTSVDFKSAVAAGWRYGKRVLIFAGVTVLVLVLPLIGARWWQSGQVRELLAAYEAADRSLLVPEYPDVEGDTVRVHLPGLTEAATETEPALRRPMYTEVLVLAMTPGPEPVPIEFQYDADHPNFQFERTITIPPAAEGVRGLTHAYYPVYFGKEARFTGFTMPASARDNLQAAYRLTEIGDMRILLNAVLPANWREAPMYQSFSR